MRIMKDRQADSFDEGKTSLPPVSDDRNFTTMYTPESTKAKVFTMYSSNSHPALGGSTPTGLGRDARGTLEHCRVVAEEWHGDSCLIEFETVQVHLPVAGALEVRVHEVSVVAPPTVNIQSTRNPR